LKSPIFLLGAHKCGTSLLRSLFDGHPDLFVIPFEAHFFPNLGHWVHYPFRKRFPQKYSWETFRRNIIRWVEHCNSSTDPLADSVCTNLFSIEEFRATLPKNIETQKESIEAYVKSIYRSLKGLNMTDDLRFLEKSVENAEFALELRSMFPDCTFIHIVRNPYSAFVSNRKYKTGPKRRFPFIKNIHGALVNSTYFLYKNRNLLPDYQIVRYEDLVTAPEKTMKQICEKIRLPFVQNLLEPTFLGQPWGGNSTSGKTFEGISTETLDKWKDEITPLETTLVNKTLQHVLDDYGYEIIERSHSPYFPCPKETPKIYIANRLYLRYFCN